jgi:hypothetical protein
VELLFAVDTWLVSTVTHEKGAQQEEQQTTFNRRRKYAHTLYPEFTAYSTIFII